MKDVAIFPSVGIWCKGNLHTHTTNSDGKLSPEQTITEYKKMGYDFLAFTDHGRYVYNKHLESDDFVVIPGIEIAIHPTDKKIYHHIAAVRSKISDKNYPDGYVFPHSEYKGLKTVQEAIDDLNAHDNFTFYCHPLGSRTEVGDFIELDGLIGMEIYNTHSHIQHNNNFGYSPTYTDGALRRGKMRHIFAVDDCHHLLNDRGKGYVMVKSDEKSEESIVDAILKGRFYSSRGPEIYEFGVKDNEVYIKCSSVREIHFIAYDPAGYSFVGEKGELRENTSCAVNESWSYVRAEIIDDHGYQAWTNPIFLADVK